MQGPPTKCDECGKVMRVGSTAWLTSTQTGNGHVKCRPCYQAVTRRLANAIAWENQEMPQEAI